MCLAEFVYLISLENFDEKPKLVRVLDRLPTGKESEIKVTFVPSQIDPLPETGVQRNDRKKGLLRWDVEVPAGATGPQAKSFEYRFKMEYDKGMTVAGLPLASS